MKSMPPLSGMKSNVPDSVKSFSKHCSHNSTTYGQILQAGLSCIARFGPVPCDDFRISSISEPCPIGSTSSQFNMGTVVRVRGKVVRETVLFLRR